MNQRLAVVILWSQLSSRHLEVSNKTVPDRVMRGSFPSPCLFRSTSVSLPLRKGGARADHGTFQNPIFQKLNQIHSVSPAQTA